MDDDPVAVAQHVVRELFGVVRWAVLSGSVLTSARTSGSDLDIVVVVDTRPGVPYRRSLTFAGWPVDLFVHDPATLQHYLAKDLARRQPSLQRMCATGILLTDPHPHHQRVQASCAAVLAAGPPPIPEAELAALRYGLSDLLDDLVHSTDQGETAVIAAVCWLRTAELALQACRYWLGSGKWLLRELRDHDLQLAERWLAASGDPDAVAALARQILDHAGGRLFDGYHAAGERPPGPAGRDSTGVAGEHADDSEWSTTSPEPSALQVQPSVRWSAVTRPVDRGLRGIFDQDAELYDRVRPGYPAELFAYLAEHADLGPHRRILEIGAGTGKATIPLAINRCRIVAVELGASMAAVCARNLAAFPNVEVVNAGFEDWPLPAEPFDIVLAATSWHWLDPTLRVTKTAQALRPGGLLAVIETHHVAGGDDRFFADVQLCYERHDPTTKPRLRLPAAGEVPRRADTDGSGLFEPATFHRRHWQEMYPTTGYLDLLMSYSGHRALPEPARAGLLTCIADLIDSRYGGRVTKRYLTQLWVARRTAG